MKITRLQMENFKRITAAEITPDSHLVVLSGANAQGKTSILDGIWAALGGGAASKAIDRPVRDGATEARVRLELGDLIVTRHWKGEKSTLTVTARDGAKLSSPQAVLDGLVGKLSFDPLAFATLAPAKQREILLGLVDLPFDPADLDAQRWSLFEERTRVNRQVKELDGQLAGFLPLPADLPAEELSVSALLQELRQGEALTRQVEAMFADAAAADRRVADLKAQLAEAEAEAEELGKAADTAPKAPDLEELRERLESVDETNALIRERDARENLTLRRDSTAASSAALTRSIEAIDEEKAAGLAAAVFPVPGLGFDEEGVTFNGVPFSQASSAERLRVSTAMGMALNPKLRVMHIRDASLLDSANMEALAGMAEAEDFQLWVERVDETGGVGIVVEDGTVRAATAA